MKTEELMIGDWVMYEGHPYQIRQLGIYGEDRDGNDYPAVCIGKQNGIGLIVERNEIEPIPITPVILEKLGFVLSVKDKNCEIYEYKEDDDIFMQIRFYLKDKTTIARIEKYNFESKYYMNNLHNCNIKYIHQLQQAMKVCEINKEIEL